MTLFLTSSLQTSVIFAQTHQSHWCNFFLEKTCAFWRRPIYGLLICLQALLPKALSFKPSHNSHIWKIHFFIQFSVRLEGQSSQSWIYTTTIFIKGFLSGWQGSHSFLDQSQTHPCDAMHYLNTAGPSHFHPVTPVIVINFLEKHQLRWGQPICAPLHRIFQAISL